MWPYPWTHVGTPSHLGHMDRVAATMPSQAHAGAAQEAPDIGQWEGQDVPLVRPSSCNVKGGIPSSRRYLPTYLPMPVHGGSPPHDAAVAGPRHPHPKLPPPHRGGHARHRAMLLPDPQLPPANTPARPGADMATPPVTHVPAQPRQRRHASTSTHRSPGKTRAHARCPNLHPRSRYLQDPASYARPRSPGPSAVSHSPLLRLRLHNLHQHDHLIHHHHHVLIQHSTPQAAGDTSQTGP